MPRDTTPSVPGNQNKGNGKGDKTMKFKGKRPEPKQDAPAGRVAENSSVVFRAAGVSVTKRTRVSYPQATVLSVKYEVLFDGHPVMDFPRMGEAVERAKQPAPEKVEQEADAPTEEAVSETNTEATTA